MFIERPPWFFRLLYREALWRLRREPRAVYLTFDDGPIPEVTPWVLDVLDRHGVKATFFCVGDNAGRHPYLLQELRRRGHSVGNHTMNHVQSRKMSVHRYLRNIKRAEAAMGHTRLFRPPHGLMRCGLSRLLRRHGYQIVMFDLVTRDYDRRLTGEQVLANVKRLARPGAIIVFHDSLKAEANIRYALPRAIEWLKEQGYEFLPL